MAGPRCASKVYYFEVGLGDWLGDFHFRVTNWGKFWADSIGYKNRLLVISMALVSKLLGASKIFSRLEAFPSEGEAGVASNDVRITKWGVTVYRLRERYILNADCRQVWVKSQERFGPIPFLFNVTKEHPAEIAEDGLGAVYYIPLVGAQWVGRYKVRPDRQHIDSELTCAWAVAEEVIDRAR